MDAAARGAAALEGNRASDAVREYTSALSSNPGAVNYWVQRSVAYARLKPVADHVSALADAETATVLAHRRAKAELIAAAQFRRAVSLYALGRFADCQQCLDWAERRNKADKAIPIWRMKVGDKLAALEADDPVATAAVSEIPDVDVDAQMKLLEIKDGKAGATAAKKDTMAKASAAASSATTSEDKNESTAAAASTSAAAPSFTPANKIRHDWYQSTDTVTVSLMAKGVPKDSANIDIQAGSLSISFPLPTGSDYDFSLDPLFAKIVPTESTHKIMSTKVEFVLKKATPGQKWSSLEGTGPVASEPEEGATSSADSEAVRRAALGQTSTKPTGPAYPTSSRTGPKDWDKVVTDLNKDPSKSDSGFNDDDDDVEGGDEANNFFRKLYKNADPDTRRAMMKSFQESNGTALSTNWSDVSSKTFETQPPDGMEAKKWEI